MTSIACGPFSPAGKLSGALLAIVNQKHPPFLVKKKKKNLMGTAAPLWVPIPSTSCVLIEQRTEKV